MSTSTSFEKNHLPRSRSTAGMRNERLRHALLLSLIAAIGLALTMNGAVAAPYRQIAVLLLIIPLIATLGTRIDQPATRRLFRWSMSLAGAFLGLALVQSMPLSSGSFTHPVWDQLSDLGIATQHTISVAPSTTLSGIPALILPFCVFAAMLLLCQDKRTALLAWKALAVLGLLLTALSAFLELALPEITFFSRFEVGRGAFNGVFVNRNTTAAFLGLTAFATAAWVMLPRRDTSPETVAERFDWSRIIVAALLFLVLIALITTRSRAGVTLALICVTLAMAMVVALRPDYSRQHVRHLSVRAKVFLTLGSGVALFIAFGEPVVSRMAVTSDDGRLCVWMATIKMIEERPLLGWGFGTFADVFPQFRDPDCLGTHGAWTRAHNSHLEFLAGMGLVGGLLSLVALFVLVHTLLSGVQMRRSLQAIPVLSLGALAFVLLHSVLDFPLQIPGVALYFAALMGAGCAVSILTRSAKTMRRRPLPSAL